jgi:FkbM family methyltransferase
MKNFIKEYFRKKQYERAIEDILYRPLDRLEKRADLIKKSKSQLRQDLFVLLETDFKENGFFVEFGATNGVDLSNTHILEKEFHWNGILAEPARAWHTDLQKNRSCSIEMNCVWSDSDSILDFNETNETELSTITKYKDNDWASKKRQHGTIYPVSTISLVDLLIKHNAPKVVDYLSIDTEGSEYQILSNFNFDAYQFRVITCEHNYTPMREQIYDLLTSNGYQRKYVELSKWDDWYIKPI